jgi:hypothetical protein
MCESLHSLRNDALEKAIGTATFRDLTGSVVEVQNPVSSQLRIR